MSINNYFLLTDLSTLETIRINSNKELFIKSIIEIGIDKVCLVNVRCVNDRPDTTVMCVIELLFDNEDFLSQLFDLWTGV